MYHTHWFLHLFDLFIVLKNRYNKLRFYISWKFPLFYDRMCAAKFPLQLLTLCLAMVLAVSFYNAHYSFAASIKNSAKAKKAAMVAAAGKDEAENLVVATQAAQRNQAVQRNQTGEAPGSGSAPNESSGQLETLIKTEVVLQQQVTKAEALLKEKEQQAKRLEQKVESAKNLLRASNENLESITPNLKLYNADWFQQLPADHFVVQIAAATEQQVLVDYAADRAFNSPLAIYPFKVNKDGEVVYGLSTGLFIVQDDALTELPVLSEMSDEHGVWVRRVADIKDELSDLQQNSILR